MATLTGRTVGASYLELLKLNTATPNTGVTGSLIDVTDGGNTASALSISTTQIASSVDGSAAAPALTRTTDTNTGVFFPAADTIAATTNGTERMRVNSSGNVGIGTTAPAAKLHASVAGATSTSLTDVLRIESTFGSATSTGFGSSIAFYGTTPGNINVDGARIAAYNQDANDNGYALGFYTRPNASDGILQRLTILRGGNVGIGTTSPLTTLHLQRTAAGVTTISNADPSQVATYVGAATTAGNYQPLIGVGEGAGSLTAVISSFDDGASGAQGLAFHTGTGAAIAERLRINSSGNVGIGTTSPTLGKLQVGTNAGVETLGGNGSIKIHYDITHPPRIELNQNIPGGTGGPSGAGIGFTLGTAANSMAIRGSAIAIPDPSTDAVLCFYTSDGTKLAERMRINYNGNIGIGTASPSAKLNVDSGSVALGAVLNSTNAVGSQLRMDNSGTAFGYIGTPNGILGSGGATGLAIRSENILAFGSGGATERLRIDASGNVGIGTTTPTAQLELSTDSAKKPTSTLWTITSDERLKTSIVDADKNRCYEIVKQVPLKRYTWKNEVYSQEQVRDRSKLGWIAQDVEEVFPKAVGTSRFAYNQVFEDVVTPELDSEGNAVFNEDGVAKTKTEKRLVSEDVIEDCRDLNADQMYAAMYGTIQKLIEKVETLEAKVLSLQVA